MKQQGRTVICGDGSIEKSLRKFKKKIQASGLLLELRERETYIKPTTRRKLKANAARNRWRKYVTGQQLPPRMY